MIFIVLIVGGGEFLWLEKQASYTEDFIAKSYGAALAKPK